jgi:hypothetical protein
MLRVLDKCIDASDISAMLGLLCRRARLRSNTLRKKPSGYFVHSKVPQENIHKSDFTDKICHG